MAKTSVPAGQLPKNVEPTHYHLEFKLNPSEKIFSGKSTINIKVNEPTKVFYLHGLDLTINSTSISSKTQKSIKAETIQTEVEGVLKVTTNQSLLSGDYVVSFEYDAPFNENLEGLHRVKDGEQYYAFTQFESIYARYAFPSFDEPRFKTPYDISLVIPKSLKAISNTPEINTQSLKNNWQKITFKTSKPLPTYLVAIAVGDFDIVKWQDLPSTQVRKKTIPLRGIATKGKGKKLAYALENTQSIVEALEDYFQIPYPYEKLDILAVPDFAAGAMENAGAITYREQLLLLDETSSISQKRTYKSVHAHELAHQWFGNLVTPVWWNDIWLNEAFATWMAATALHRQWPEEQWQRQQISRSKRVMASDSIPSARKIRNPIESNSDIITAFDGITYSKGGGVLSMIEAFMGKDNFQKGVQKHMQKYRWGNSDALDFFESIASVLEPQRAKEVLKSFRDFVEQSGVPLLDITQSCDNQKTKLNITQERYTPLGTQFKEQRLWSIPTCMNYEIDGKIKQQCQVLAKAEQTIQLKSTGCSDWVMPNAQASGYYRFNLESKDWKSLLANLNKLDPQEANAVLDSMKAAFSSGKLSVKALFDVIPSTLTSDSWEVTNWGLETLSSMIRFTDDEKDKQKLREIAANIYRNSANKLGFKDNTKMDKEQPLNTSKLRSRLISFMALTSKDKHYRQQLTQMARQYIGYQKDNKLHDKVIIPALRATALSVAVQELGMPFVKAVIQQVNLTTDGTIRGRLIRSLTATENPEIAKSVLAFGMGKEIRDNEKASFLFGFVGKKELDAVMWPWLQENFDGLMKELPTNYQTYAPYIIPGGCEQKKMKRLNSFLKPKLKGLIGADKNFVKAIDSLKQCIAQKAYIKPQIKSLLATFE